MLNIVQWLFGWRFVGTEYNLKSYVHPNILPILKKKSEDHFSYFLKTESKKPARGRTIRGKKILPDYPGCTVFAKGNTYLYKAKVPENIWIDNHGHGGYVRSRTIKIYRKKIK